MNDLPKMTMLDGLAMPPRRKPRPPRGPAKRLPPTLDQQWQLDRVLTPKQFAAALKRLGLSVNAGARFFGVSSRTARRYLIGRAVIPISIVLLIHSMLHHGDVPYAPRWSSDQT